MIAIPNVDKANRRQEKAKSRWGGALIKSSKIFYCPFCFFHLGSLGIYADKMDPNFLK